MQSSHLKGRAALALCAVAASVLIGCAHTQPGRHADPAAEKARILGVLNGETRAALGRDYEAWREHWVHAPYVAKTYVNVADGTGSETRGWDAVDTFVRTYLEEHPEPESPPPPLTSADVRLYSDGAWVSYEQQDADQGWKRESRLMEKVGGRWKIAGMHTTVYGPVRPE